MTLEVRLLGRPSLMLDGTPRALAGAKPWGLLCFLILETRPVSRREMAERLWPEAADPLAALRWSLLQARRAIEPGAEIEDVDGSLLLRPADLEVDARALLAGEVAPEDADQVVQGELLEGLAFDDAPDFDLWLSFQRTRVRSAATSTLRWAGVLTSGRDPHRALALLERVLQLDPYDDVAHETCVGIHVARGDRAAARAHLQRAEHRYRDDLAEPLPATVRRPLDRAADAGGRHPTTTPAARARALLEAATARLDAGEYEASISSARNAAVAAADAGDPMLEARSLLALAGTLVHSVRGRDREAGGLLARAIVLAEAAGDQDLVAQAEREVGWVAFLDADYGAAESSLARAIDRSRRCGDAVGAARALVVVGACRSDRSELDAAELALTQAIEGLERSNDRWLAFGVSFLARIRLWQGRAAEAVVLADKSVAQARQHGWLSLVPWPLAVAGWAASEAGDAAGATERLDQALALSVEIGDPCWEAFSLRGLALVDIASGRAERARDVLRQAVARARSYPDIYTWAEALILTDLVEIEGGSDPSNVERARALARRGPMPDLLARLRSASR